MGDSSTCTALSNALNTRTPSTAVATLLPATQQEKEKKMEFTRLVRNPVRT